MNPVPDWVAGVVFWVAVYLTLGTVLAFGLRLVWA